MENKDLDINMSKYDYIYNHNKNYMDYTALSFNFENKNVCITYEQMHENINKYANLLYNYGIREGTKVGVCLINTPESVYILYALDKLGAIVIGLSPLNNDYKMGQDIEMTKPSVIITVDLMYSKIRKFEESHGFSSIIFSPLQSLNKPILDYVYHKKQKKIGNYEKEKDLKNLLKNDKSTDFIIPNYSCNKLTDIMFTGGSTGIHKGVELSSNGLNSVVKGMDKMFDMDPGMVHFGQIPIGHMVYGKMIMHYSLVNNLNFALSLKAMPNDFYNELLRTQPHAAVGGPPHWSALITKTEEGKKTINPILKKDSLKNLKYATSGGEAAKLENVLLENQALEFCGSKAKMGDGLGTTEMWSAVLINNGLNTIGSLGNPLDGIKIKILDPVTKEEIFDDREGELHVSAPSMMLKYHNNEEETKKVIYFDENGTKWYNTSDIVKRTENNKNEFIYVGRKKRNFVCGIDNIYPEEIESILLKLPEIREVVVTKIPDEEKQYLPKYHISVFNYDFNKQDLELKIHSLINSTLGSSALPGYIEYTDEFLKRTDNSKLDVTYYQNLDLEKNKNKIKTKIKQ